MNSRERPKRGDPPVWGLGEGLTTPHHKFYEIRVLAKGLAFRLMFGKVQTMEEVHRFGIWNVRRLSLKTVSREFARYRLGLVSVLKVSWEKGRNKRG